MRKTLLAGISSFFILALAAALAVGAGLYWYQQPSKLAAPRQLIIAPGTGFSAIAQQLHQAGIINQPLVFKVMVMLHDQHRSFKAGEYAFDAYISPKQVSHMLTRGKSLAHAITIPEGKNSREIGAMLLADERLSGPMPLLAEGSLLPDTHHVHRGDSRAALVQRMQKAQQTLMQTLWPTRQANLPIATPQEALILASIVEKETGVDGERGRVASVFVNRLRKGMKLQSDPTVVYAIERDKGPMQRPLYRKDWKYESAYNTYYRAGLPPAPICHPGVEAIKAVLNPPHEPYLYFVATGKGGHYFAKTLREHNRNIARYKRNLR